MLKLGVLVSGGGTNLQAIIDGVKSGKIGNVRMEAVISSNEKALALERARKNNIPCACVSPKDYESKTEFYQALIREIDKYNPDLLVLAGYLSLLPERLVKSYKNRIINVHPSLIPSFCGPGHYGLKVHEEAINRGVKITGATVHFVDEGTDTGPIILQKAVEVREDDTPETLQKRVMQEAEWVILPEAIDLIAKGKINVVGNRVIIGG